MGDSGKGRVGLLDPTTSPQGGDGPGPWVTSTVGGANLRGHHQDGIGDDLRVVIDLERGGVYGTPPQLGAICLGWSHGFPFLP